MSEVEGVADAVGGHVGGVGDGLPGVACVAGVLHGGVAVGEGLLLAGDGFADVVEFVHGLRVTHFPRMLVSDLTACR